MPANIYLIVKIDFQVDRLSGKFEPIIFRTNYMYRVDTHDLLLKLQMSRCLEITRFKLIAFCIECLFIRLNGR